MVRSGPPGIKRDKAVKMVSKLEARIKRAKQENDPQLQHRLCKAFADSDNSDDPRNKDPKEWMRRMVFARLMRGDYSDWTGWEFRNDWATSSYSKDLTAKRWRLEKVNSLAILGEQGLGDEAMFSSCIPDVVKLGIKEIVVECDPRLVNVFERSFGVKAIPRSDIVDRKSLKYLSLPRSQEKFIPIGDLPRLFRKRLSDFPREPFLRPLPEKVEQWGALKGRTGVAWRSRTSQYKPGDFGVKEPVCVQYEAWPYEVEGMEVPDCDLRNDIEDLLGICSNLERVVSVPQTIVHIAGSVGCRVDVVMAAVGSSRVENQVPYRYSSPMPWYSNVEVHPSLYAYRN